MPEAKRTVRDCIKEYFSNHPDAELHLTDLAVELRAAFPDTHMFVESVVGVEARALGDDGWLTNRRGVFRKARRRI